MSSLNRRDAVKLTAGMVLGAGTLAGAKLLGQEAAAEQRPQPSDDPMLAGALANASPYMFMEQLTLTLEGESRPLFITSARDVVGKPVEVRLPTASMRIFRADARLDEFTRKGGWYWRCGVQEGKSEFKSRHSWFPAPSGELGPLVMVVRQPDGTVHWFALGPDLRC